MDINNSPCSKSVNNCAGKLIKMLDSIVQARLILYVANLYNICRESCKEEYHNGFIGQKNHTDNYRGLTNLMQHERCEIKAFTKNILREQFKITTESDQLPDDYDNMEDGNERRYTYSDRFGSYKK